MGDPEIKRNIPRIKFSATPISGKLANSGWTLVIDYAANTCFVDRLVFKNDQTQEQRRLGGRIHPIGQQCEMGQTHIHSSRFDIKPHASAISN